MLVNLQKDIISTLRIFVIKEREMNELSRNESATTAEEINQLIENIKSDLNLHENAEKFVKAVDKNIFNSE